MSTTHTPTVPAARVACPACGEPFDWPPAGRCVRCGVDLTSDEARAVFDTDRAWAELATRRLRLVEALTTTRPGGAPAATPPTVPAAPVRPDRPPMGVPTLLGLAGAALLTAAAAVFTAVAWDALPVLAKAAVLLAATGAAAWGALAVQRRDIPIAAASLGLLTMAMIVVDVAGIERADLLPLDDLTPGIALLLAGAAGAALTRRGLRWVGSVGAATVVVGAGALTAGIASTAELGPVGFTLVGTALAAGLAAAATAWPGRTGRILLGVGAVAGATGAALVSVGAVGADEVAIAAGLAAAALPALLLAAATTRWPLVAAPLTLVVTAAVPATALALDAAPVTVGTVPAVALAVLAWTLWAAPAATRWPAVLGAVPVAAVTLAFLGEHTFDAVGRFSSTVVGDAAAAVDPVGALGALAVGVGALALPLVRRYAGLVAVAVAAVVVASLGAPWTWIGLLVVAGAVAPLDRPVRGVPLAPLAAAALAIGWAAGDDLTVAIAAAAATALALWLATRTDGLGAEIAWGGALAAGGLAAGALTSAAGVGLDLALGLGIVVVAAAAAGLLAGDEVATPAAPVVVLAGATLTVGAATTARAAGVLLLVAALGWLAQAVLGWWPARWVAALVASAGSWTLLADAEVEVVEAYSVVPALLLGAVGVAWLLEEPRVASVTALWPALTAGLVPSLVTLTGEPEALARTLGVAVVAGALAAAGLALRWRAPVVVGGAAAIWVALTQLAIAVEVLPRWLTFAVVGLILVWLAATYEQQHRRVVGVGQRLLRLR